MYLVCPMLHQACVGCNDFKGAEMKILTLKTIGSIFGLTWFKNMSESILDAVNKTRESLTVIGEKYKEMEIVEYQRQRPSEVCERLEKAQEYRGEYSVAVRNIELYIGEKMNKEMDDVRKDTGENNKMGKNKKMGERSRRERMRKIEIALTFLPDNLKATLGKWERNGCSVGLVMWIYICIYCWFRVFACYITSPLLPCSD